MRVFITGITGPVGSFLADYLATLPDLELHAFKRWRSDPRPIEQLQGKISIHEGDIEDPYSIGAAIAGEAGSHLPLGGAKLPQRLVGRACDDAPRQCRRDAQCIGSGASELPNSASTYRRNQRPIWYG